jgi:diguanylate cyclase (GGDEF)-like protein/PAS domain S-box-containing protein
MGGTMVDRLLARWPLFIAVAFCVYASVLLWSGFRSQEQLTMAADSRLVTEAARQAGVLGDFLAERRANVSELADAHEIETYLTNKALGMSLRYGLEANLDAIKGRLRRWGAKNVIRGKEIFNRTVFADTDGTPLAEVGPGAGPVPLPVDLAAGAIITFDREHRQIVATAPIIRKDAFVGAVVAFSDIGVLSGYLRSEPDGAEMREALLTARGEDVATPQATPWLDPALGRAFAGLPENHIVSFSDVAPTMRATDRVGMVVVRTPIPGSTLSLITIVGDRQVYGHITSRALLYLLSALPPLALLAALLLEQMRRRNRALQARYIETTRRSDELRDRNTALSEEISRRKAVEAALRDSEQRFRKLFDGAPLPSHLVDPSDGSIVDCNDAAAAMLGYERDALRRMRVADIDPIAENREFLWRQPTLMGQSVQFETQHRTRSGEIRDVAIASVPIDIAQRRLACMTVVDITERKLAEKRILHLAHHDALTGLPNRILLNERIAKELERAGRQGGHFAILYLDLDGFKTINDTMGHDAGDVVLSSFADHLRSLVRLDETVARTGGDEFAILLHDLSQPGTAEQVAQRLLDGLPLSVDLGGYAWTLGGSIGIAVYPEDGTDCATLQKNADTALYRAKADGKGSSRRFESWMDHSLAERRSLERDLRLAIEHHEIEVFFQPQFACDTLRVTGFEALVRWNHAERGFVPPGVFIPLAEECGLIMQIGRTVLEQSCTLAAGWRPRCRVAVNLSPVQFRDSGLLSLLSSVLLSTGFPASLLELEVTEGVLIKDEEQALGTLRALKDLGVHIALDDFGTGYSGLSYLRSFPFDGIKIDKCFVHAQQQDAGTRTILEAVLAMSNRLNLRVIAEGVETEEQLAMLRKQGCAEVQGFLLGRPMPASEVQDFLRSMIDDGGRYGHHLRVAASNTMAPTAEGHRGADAPPITARILRTD